MSEAMKPRNKGEMMNIPINNRWTNACIWEGGIEDCGTPSLNLGLAVKAALLSGVNLSGAYLSGADLSGVDLRGAYLRGAYLRGVYLRGVGKIATLRVLTGLYQYQCMAIVTESGAPLVRMGCLCKSIEECDRITIRASNLSEFPDDGSPKCENRVRAFDFVRDMALRMAGEWAENNQKNKGVMGAEA